MQFIPWLGQEIIMEMIREETLNFTVAHLLKAKS